MQRQAILGNIHIILHTTAAELTHHSSCETFQQLWIFALIEDYGDYGFDGCIFFVSNISKRMLGRRPFVVEKRLFEYIHLG